MKTLLPVFFMTATLASSAIAGVPGFVQPIPTTQLPSNGSCSSADGSVQFESFQHQGGALMEGALLNSRSIKVDGVEWGSSSFFQGSNAGQDNWNVVVELTDKTVLESEGSPQAGSTTYAVLLTVESTIADLAPKTSYVICEDSWLFAP